MIKASESLRRLFSTTTGIDESVLSKTDIQKMPLDSQVISEIKKSLSSNDRDDITTGFLFFNSLLEVNKPSQFGEGFYEFLIVKVRELIKHESKYVCYQALEVLVWLKDNFSDYRNIMIGYLKSDDLGFKRIALYNYESFSEEKEVTPLLRFNTDDYAAEKSMNSDLVYELRDVALDKIGKVVGKHFCSSRVNEPFDGTVVSWYDWTQFWEWWGQEKANYL